MKLSIDLFDIENDTLDLMLARLAPEPRPHDDYAWSLQRPLLRRPVRPRTASSGDDGDDAP